MTPMTGVRRTAAAAVAVVAAAGLAVTTAAPATAEHGQFTVTETVRVGNPGVVTYGLWTPAHITNQFARCDPESDLNGLDGVWYDIEGFGGNQATLTMDPDSLFEVHWYDESCTYTGALESPWLCVAVCLTEDPREMGETVTATVPEDARYAIVDLYYGADATFTLTIGSGHSRPHVRSRNKAGQP